MALRKTLFALLTMVSFAGFIYAQGIASREEAPRYFNEGVKAQKTGNFEKADKEYSMAIMLDSKYYKLVLHNRGVMYALRGDYASAVEAFKEVLSLDPKYMPARLNLGRIYDIEADKCTALQYWAEVLNIERYKPKTFVIEEEQKSSPKDSGSE